jgi:CDP-diglyceride synthetase
MIALLHSRKVYWSKIVRTYISKKTIEGFMGVVFCIVALVNFKILYHCRGKMFIWIIALIVFGTMVILIELNVLLGKRQRKK